MRFEVLSEAMVMFSSILALKRMLSKFVFFRIGNVS